VKENEAVTAELCTQANQRDEAVHAARMATARLTHLEQLAIQRYTPISTPTPIESINTSVGGSRDVCCYGPRDM
jgi:hypothetical protein